MNTFSFVQLGLAAPLLATFLLSSTAIAQTAQSAASLLPLETRNMEIEPNPDLYRSAAEGISSPAAEQAAASDDSDVLGADLFEGFVDENGDVSLPLGLTVFDAMGATSVGFGSEF